MFLLLLVSILSIKFTGHSIIFCILHTGVCAICSFLDGTSSTYLEELEERYRADPSSVDKTWASFFNSLGMLLHTSFCATPSCLTSCQYPAWHLSIPCLALNIVTIYQNATLDTIDRMCTVHVRQSSDFMVLLSEPFVCSLPTAEQGVAPEAVAEAYHAYEQGSKVAPLSAAAVSNQTIQESQRLLLLVRAYQAIFSWSAFLQSTKCCSQGSSSLSMTCQRLPGARILSSGNVHAACRHLTAWIYSKDKGKLGIDNWIAIRLCKDVN